MTNRISEEDMFYSRSKYQNWHIDDDIVNALKEFKSSHYEGAYVEFGIEYRKSDNIDIIKKYSDNSLIFLNRCFLAIQFLTRFVKLSDIDSKYISDNQINKNHIQLLNNLYFSESDEIEEYDGYAIQTADKRPFGNSSYEYDILNIMQPNHDREYDLSDNWRESPERKIAQESYKKVMDLAKHVISTFPIKFRNFEYAYDARNLTNRNQIEYHNHNWTPAISEFRDISMLRYLKEIDGDRQVEQISNLFFIVNTDNSGELNSDWSNQLVDAVFRKIREDRINGILN